MLTQWLNSFSGWWWVFGSSAYSHIHVVWCRKCYVYSDNNLQICEKFL